MLIQCQAPMPHNSFKKITEPSLIVLGIAQDAGYPQAGCEKSCCTRVWKDAANKRYVSCLALVDPVSKKRWIFDATPDFREQMHRLNDVFPTDDPNELTGIFLTHAHIGHYTGLMHLGREVMGAKKVPTYVMPRMSAFLKSNAPWSQLVDLQNIDLQPLAADIVVQLTPDLSVIPFLVPHRDELSETVGYHIQSKNKTAIFIPDIDKWGQWDQGILEVIKGVDIAFLDGTFFKNGEIKGRDMSEIPHPFIEESMSLFEKLSPEDRAKVHFIHFNHTNPVLIEGSEAQKTVEEMGFNIAKEMSVFGI